MVSVLLVEDEACIHELLTFVLDIHGHSIVGNAFSGTEAIEVFSNMQPKPDIILMDFRMPMMNGIDATKSIIEIDPSARIVFVCADSTIRDAAIKSGACDFLTKPVSCSELVACVERNASSGGQYSLTSSCVTK
ncbi:MAG: response regulator [Candidatus Thorarchaeota archaeon]|nr:response regulator [Candidatus Thorarchaeota archaeon]